MQTPQTSTFKMELRLCRQSRLYEYEYEARTALGGTLCSLRRSGWGRRSVGRNTVLGGNAWDSAEQERKDRTIGRRMHVGCRPPASSACPSCQCRSTSCRLRRQQRSRDLPASSGESAFGRSATRCKQRLSWRRARRHCAIWTVMKPPDLVFTWDVHCWPLGKTADGEALVDETRRFFEQVDARFRYG